MSDIYAKSFKFGENGDRLYPLPIVTEEDNDSVLSVVNGELAKTPITDAEKYNILKEVKDG